MPISAALQIAASLGSGQRHKVILRSDKETNNRRRRRRTKLPVVFVNVAKPRLMEVARHNPVR
jgi:hypothetical protein